MKQRFNLLLIISMLYACNDLQPETDPGTETSESLNTPTTEKQKAVINIKDKTLYDQDFIDGLSDYNDPIKLMGDFILIGGDTTYFPSDLNLNKKTTFNGRGKNQTIVLSVTRISMTSLSYNLQINDQNNKTVENKSGQASLASLFFLAPEGDEDSVMNAGYGSYEYYDNSKACSLSIRIGIGVDDNGKQRAKVIYACEDKNKAGLSLDDCPVLRTE